MRTFSVLFGGIVGLAVIAAGLVGCNSTRNLRRGPQGTVVIGNLPPAPEPSRVAPPPMVWALDVLNAQGSVTVHVDPKVVLPIVTVRAPELKDRTDPALWVASEAVEEDGKRLLRVAAMGPEEQKKVSLYLSITVPAVDGVRVRNAGGAVELWDVAGKVDVESGDPVSKGSSILVKTSAPLTTGVRAVTNTGDVRVFCGEQSSGLVEVRGARVSVVTPALGKGGQLTGVKHDATAFAARIGASEAPIEIKSAKGLADLRFDQKPKK